MTALSLFILGSAYHFGEQHWENIKLQVEGLWKKIFYLFYGMFILSLLFWLNDGAVTEIIAALSGKTISGWMMAYLFYISSILLALLWIFISLKGRIFRNGTLEELGYLVVFTIIFKVSSLMWGFAIYFIFWHSLPSLYDQVHFLYNKVDRKSALAYVKTSLPYWLISVVGIVLLYYVFKNQDIFYALFFSFLAAVTFPHSLAIHEMFKRKRPKNDV